MRKCESENGVQSETLELRWEAFELNPGKGYIVMICVIKSTARTSKFSEQEKIKIRGMYIQKKSKTVTGTG